LNRGQLVTHQDHKSTGPGPQTADRIGAVSEFLLDRESLLPVVASHLGHDAIFESAIRGSSMCPAIPKFSRVRVQLLGTRCPGPGDVLYFLADDGFMIHRVVHQVLAGSGERFYITIGDNCLVPDPPVPEHRVLGVVITVETTSGRRPPGPPRSGSVLHRTVRGVSVPATYVASRISVPAAGRVAALFRWFEDVARAPVGRALRSVGLLRGG
jgi:hypothetical protein